MIVSARSFKVDTSGKLSVHAVRRFRKLALGYYREHGRNFPWRSTNDPYHILVSEFMLQQTQTSRVLGKYERFLEQFPTVGRLAESSLGDVIREWSGLGYNRRAASLHRTAEIVVRVYGGFVPSDHAALCALPGIGPATAGAIRAFAFAQDAVFIETNIRRVFLHFFFPRRNEVTDSELTPLIAQTLDSRNPRKWYYALMDLGAGLVADVNPNSRSAHYHAQSAFVGSDRRIRGRILKLLIAFPLISGDDLPARLNEDPIRVRRIADTLVREGLIILRGECYSLP